MNGLWPLSKTFRKLYRRNGRNPSMKTYGRGAEAYEELCKISGKDTIVVEMLKYDETVLQVQKYNVATVSPRFC